jgi:two-component system sensor histidine kinase YesM
MITGRRLSGVMMKFSEKTKEKIQRTSIRSRIFIAMIVVSVGIISLLGSVIYGYSRKVIESNYQSIHLSSLQIASNVIELQLNNDAEQARSMLNDEAFKTLFKDEKTGTKTFGNNKVLMERALLKYSSSNNDIRDILVVNNAGNLSFVSKYDLNRQSVNEYYSSDNILDRSWVSDAIAANGKEVFYGENVLFSEDDKDDADKSFSMVKEMIDPDTQKAMGFLVFNIRKSSLSATTGTHDEGYSTGRYMILDKAHVSETGYPTVVYSTDSVESLKRIMDAYTGSDSDIHYLFTTYENEVSGWDMVNVVDKKDLSGTTKYIGLMIAVLCLVMVALSAYLSYRISKSLTYRLGRLEKTIQQVSDGNYDIEEVFDNSEVGKIGNQFKKMVNSNHELNDKLLKTKLKERESELLLLQTQINPHFLYNTLDALYFMAVIHSEDEIAEMVHSLSDTFRLSLNRGEKFITVRDELNRLKAYMKVQSFRYKDRFSLILNVEEGILDSKIMVFIIQPLVENAFYHGLEPKIGKGWIKVGGIRSNGCFVFTVEDNGVGMEDISAALTGYGLKNIEERIELYYGEGYGLKFSSTKGEGTIVTVVVPEEAEEARLSGGDD